MPGAPRPPSVVRRVALVGALALGLLIPAACGGSDLDPVTVRAANEGVEAQVGGSGGSTGTAGSGGTTSAGTGAGSQSSSGPGPGSGTTGTGGATTSSGAAGGSAGGSAATGTGAHSATGSVAKASCSGFKNSTGITSKTISIANISDISGPVPGLFTAAQQATKAYVAYFNATSSICGRKLSLDAMDSRTDAGADQQDYQKACESDFAAVGSMSAFDSGGAPVAQGCGLPDMRTATVTVERAGCTTCFAAEATNAHEFENAVPDFFVKNYHAASQKGAFLYINAGASAQNAKTQIAVEQKRGMKIIYSAGIDVSEFNYGPYVQAMKDKGVRWVQFLGAYQEAARLAQSMQSDGFKPDVYMLDPTGYNPDYVKTAGSAGEGTIVFMNFVPFEEARSNKEMELYLQWLNQVAPGATPSFFGLFAWSAARLFVEQATSLGGKLTRSALIAKLRGVRNWTDNGLHAPQPVGSKQASDCYRFLQLRHGTWVPLGGSSYQCHGISTAS